MRLLPHESVEVTHFWVVLYTNMHFPNDAIFWLSVCRKQSNAVLPDHSIQKPMSAFSRYASHHVIYQQNL